MVSDNTYQEYQNYLKEQIKTWKYQIAGGVPVSIPDLWGTLDPAQDNSEVRNWAVEAKLFKSSRDFDAGLKNLRLTKKFGFNPVLARDLMSWHVENNRVTVRYSGEVRDGETKDFDTIEDLKRALRLIRDEYFLAMSDSQITDAVDDWYIRAMKARLPAVRADVGFRTEAVEAAEPHWEKILAAGWGEDQSPEFIRGVLVKYIWQVKRKMAGIKVTNHLMPVLVGPQKTGKTTFNTLLTSPLAELRAETNFGQIADDRNIDLWKHLVIVIPEMSKSTSADVEAVKSAITAETRDMRPMRSNKSIKVKQMATLIGDSNRSLAELFNDTTGLRRYAELYFNGKNREVLIEVDWVLIWRSVDERLVDPSLAIMDQLEEQQEAARRRSPVEEWMLTNLDLMFRDGFVTGDKLWTSFRDYLDIGYPKHSYTIQIFRAELARLAQGNPDWVRKRATSGWTYRRALPLVSIRDVEARTGIAKLLGRRPQGEENGEDRA